MVSFSRVAGLIAGELTSPVPQIETQPLSLLLKHNTKRHSLDYFGWKLNSVFQSGQ